jgi:hypothetical protein
MIIQLANGRIIECSTEVYLSLTDEEVQELEGISTSYTKFVGNPFYNMFHKGRDAAIQDMDDEYEPRLDEIDEREKMNDPYFNNEEQSSNHP